MQISIFDSSIRRLCVACISGYQKHISPHKGFACAHRVLYGGESCSQYIKSAIAKEGLRVGVKKSRDRFDACKTANQILQARRQRARDILVMRSQTEDESESGEEFNQRTTRDKCNPCRKRNRENCWDLGEVGCEFVDVGCDCADCLGSLTDLDCGFLDCGGCGS